MKYKKLIPLGMAFLIMAACQAAPDDKTALYKKTESVNLANEDIKSVAVDSAEKELFDEFGNPLIKEEDPDGIMEYVKYEGVEFAIAESRVMQYLVTGRYSTRKDIRVGASREKVIETYGENFYEREDSGVEIIGYVDKNNRLNIEFGIQEGEVKEIKVEKVEMSADS